MLPWSVMARAGWPSAFAAATASPTRAAPSSIENSVWLCRWTKDTSLARFPLIPRRCTGRFHSLWTNHTNVIRLGANLTRAPPGSKKVYR